MNSASVENRTEGYRTQLGDNFGKFDQIHSTFRWEIYLDKTQRAKNAFYGYSKGVGVPENEDKAYVLKSRLFESVFINNDYYQKIDRIEVYFNQAGKRGGKVLTMFPTEYILHEPNEELEKDLKQTYDKIKVLQNQPRKTFDSVFKKRNKQERNDRTASPTDLILTMKGVTSLEIFHERIRSLESQNYPKGAIDALKKKALNKHPEWFRQEYQHQQQKADPRAKYLKLWKRCREGVRKHFPEIWELQAFQDLRFGVFTKKDDKPLLILMCRNTEHWQAISQLRESADYQKIIQKILVTFEAQSLSYRLPLDESQPKNEKSHEEGF